MNKNKKRISDILSIVGLLVIIYGFAVAMILLPDKTFSEEENRTLQTFPKFTLEALDNGSYTKKIGTYFADQIPLRGLFVGTKAACETWLGKHENNNVIIGRDGHIIAKSDFANYTVMDKNLGAIREFDESNELDLRVAIAPRAQDALLSYMPELYPAKEISEREFARVFGGLDGVEQVDLLTPLRLRAKSGEYVYYRTDHHWTTLGAYYAYVEIIKSYGIEPYPIEYFSRETVSEEFFGTTWSKAGMRWIAPDSMEFFRFDGDEAFVTEITDNDTELEGFYDFSYLDKKDKYSAFIGGNNGRVRISIPQGKVRETLVLVKDSFGHSVAPFLAMHFNLEIIDFRYYKQSFSELLEQTGADKVLILYNLDSLAASSELLQLNY